MKRAPRHPWVAGCPAPDLAPKHLTPPEPREHERRPRHTVEATTLGGDLHEGHNRHQSRSPTLLSVRPTTCETSTPPPLGGGVPRARPCAQTLDPPPEPREHERRPRHTVEATTLGGDLHEGHNRHQSRRQTLLSVKQQPAKRAPRHPGGGVLRARPCSLWVSDHHSGSCVVERCLECLAVGVGIERSERLVYDGDVGICE